MIASFDTISSPGAEFDVCIVGTGPAGLAVATTLANSPLRVLVLEAGAAKRTRTNQEPFFGSVARPEVHPNLDNYRVRALGGASSIWGGRCIPFDRIDFEPRAWVPDSGWPIGYDDLVSYYAPAMRFAEAGGFDCLPETALPGKQIELLPGLDGEGFRTTVERFSKPTNVWTRYRELLTAAPNIALVSEATLTRIGLAPDAASVEHLEIASPDKRRARIRSRLVVLAMGGFETTRLLLASTDVRSAGVGNDYDLVGRYYMAHLCATVGELTAACDPARVACDYETDRDGIYVRRRLWLTEAAQRGHQLLNTTLRTHVWEPANPRHKDPVLSSMFLVKRLVQYEYAQKFQNSRVSGMDRLAHLRNIVTQPLKLADFSQKWLRYRVLAERKLPSVVLSSDENLYPMEFHAEQAPNRESRVMLSGERDSYGVPRLLVDWRITELDRASLRGTYALLAVELRRTGAGALRYSDADLDHAAKHGVVGGHHVGTTRMAAEPRRGVVDTDCRVHGVRNLFIAGSSVLPTSGQANPTLTAIALGLRLAGHLRTFAADRPALSMEA